MTDREKITEGKCVSEMGVDRCPVCVDRCEAAHWRMEINRLLAEAQVSKPKEK